MALILALLAAPAAAQAPGFIRAQAGGFVNPDGSPFLVKGMSFGNWMVPEGYMFKFKVARAPREIEAVIEHLAGPDEAARFWQRFRDLYIGQDDIAFMKAAGFTTVRVPLHWKLFVDPADHGRFEGEGWALLDRLVAWCRQAGLKVIIDLHAAPGGQTGVNHDDGVGYPLTFYVPAHQRLTVELWRRIAQRYRDEPAVLAYDLLNEPISPYHDIDYLNPRLEPFYRQIVEAIRSVDANHVVMLAAAQWSREFAVFGPPFDANAAYTYHKFWASRERREVQDYVNFSRRWGVPIVLGETGELTDEWNAGYRAMNERFGIGWSFWTYKNLDSSSTVVSIPKPAGWDAIAAFGNVSPSAWPSMTPPPREEVLATLDAYLEAMKFPNARVNRGYVESLGLRVP
ncbi:MAG TPA: cellulase family glycosylhydrolase [Xanthobacteraceae bacterium]|nr:cellulase family glycosylhydrolase [Xanthobacteraceae bacterium]